MLTALKKAIRYMEPDIDYNTRLYIPFNEGTGSVAKDYSQFGNHADLTDVLWGIGINGSAGIFNGSTSVGNCGNDASLNITDAITAAAYVNSSANGSIVWRGTDGTNGMWGLDYDSGKLRILYATENSFFAADILSGVIPVTDGTRHYVVGTFDGSNMRLYVDGVPDGVKAKITKPTPKDTTTFIGAYRGTSLYFNGTMNNILILAKAQPSEQIAADCYV